MADDYVLYDGECPACTRYVAATGLAHCSGIKLIDARSHPELVAEHAVAGRLIDDGMMVSVDGVVHFGADATKKLAELGQPATPAARFLLWFVGRAPWAKTLYPALSAGRRWLLRRLGRPLIAPPADGS